MLMMPFVSLDVGTMRGGIDVWVQIHEIGGSQIKGDESV